MPWPPTLDRYGHPPSAYTYTTVHILYGVGMAWHMLPQPLLLLPTSTMSAAQQKCVSRTEHRALWADISLSAKRLLILDPASTMA